MLTLPVVFAIAVAVEFFVAISFYPTLAWNRVQRRPLAVLAILLIALAPLVIPATARFPRLLTSVIGIALIVKIYDLHRTCGPALQPTFSAYAVYLPNWLSVVWRKLRATPHPTQRENTRRLGVQSIRAAAAVALLVWLFHRDWTSVPFLVEHAVKVFSFFLALIPISHAYTALWRLC